MSLLSSIGSGIARVAGGFLTAGPAGAIGAAAGAFAGTTVAPRASPTPPTMFGGGGFQMPFPVAGPGGALLPGFGGTSAATSCAKGYHLNKHALQATKKHGIVPAHSMCVRNRSINPLNPRAVTRSLKRLKRARKLVTKLHAFGASRSTAVARRGGHRAGCGCAICRRR